MCLKKCTDFLSVHTKETIIVHMKNDYNLNNVPDNKNENKPDEIYL